MTTWQIGLGVQANYNSQVIQPVSLAGQGMTGVGGSPFSGDALTLSLAPFVALSTQSGRFSEQLRVGFLYDGILLLSGPQGLSSYQTSLSSQTRADLTSRLVWTLGLVGSQGQLNSFAQSQDPATRNIEAINAVVTDFVSVGATSLFLWEPNARIKISQPVNFRTFVPYNVDLGTQPAGTGSGPVRQLQSYTLDGGVGVDYQWARASLGSELRIGWFLPQNSPDPLLLQDDQSVLTGQLIARTALELSPRWQANGNVGVFVATQASHFLEGRRQIGDPNAMNPTFASATLVSPIGGADVRYLFPGLNASIGLSYLHSAAGEVFIGKMTVSDAVTLRAFVPLPKEFSISASAGYRYSQLTDSGGFSGTQIVNGVEVPFGQSYHLVQADGSVSWRAREWLLLFVRYQYMNQVISGEPAPGDLPLLSFDRHLATVGMTLSYPPRQ